MPQEGPKTPPNAKTALAVLAALVGVGTAASLVSDTKKDEGVVHVAYRDLGGVWSICSGSTHGVAPGETDTDEQCDARTADDLAKAARIVLAVSPRLKAPDMHQQLRAVIRFQNNTGKYPVSSARLAFNAGRYREGCDRLLAYNGIVSGKPIRGAIEVRRLKNCHYFSVIQGLKNRRANEHAVCVSNLPQ
jgi:lysozyme